MIKSNHLYSISDANGVLWGEVELTSIADQFTGYLKATDAFEEVFSIFEAHDVLMSEEGSIEREVEDSAQEIIDLQPMLQSLEFGVVKAGIVFVSKTKKGFLLVCGGQDAQGCA